MVVAEGPNEYILYAQNDHGDLAGVSCEHSLRRPAPAPLR
jgi:hypothetical protein